MSFPVGDILLRVQSVIVSFPAHNNQYMRCRLLGDSLAAHYVDDYGRELVRSGSGKRRKSPVGGPTALNTE